MTATETIKKLETVKAELKKVVMGRDDIIDTLVLALASNEHILIMGKHGEAKSYSVNKLNQLTNLNSFSIQLHRETTLKDIVGMINPVEYQKGKLDLIRTKFFDANILFCDEFLRARTEFLDFLLEVMIERRTTKTVLGEVKLPIISVIATTNPLTEEYNTERLDLALKDRFYAIINLNHMIEENKNEDIKKILDETNNVELQKVNLTSNELIELKSHALKSVKVENCMIVELFTKLHEKNFNFSTRTIKLFKEIMQVSAFLKGKEKVDDDDFFYISKLMLKNRFDKLTEEMIESITDECLIYVQHKDTIIEIDKTEKIDDVELFIEKAVDIIDKHKEEFNELPKRLQDRIIDLTKKVKKTMLENVDKINDKILGKLDTERFKDVFETFIEGKTLQTRFLSKGQLKDVHNIVKNIKYCDVAEKTTEDFIKFIITPKIAEPKSFKEIKAIERELHEKQLLVER